MNSLLSPVLVKNNTVQAVEHVESSEYNEAFIRDLCFENPNLIPISEIDTKASSLISLCTEMSIKSGFCDVLFIDQNGIITIVECKLFKNPEAERKVIAQLLDYAKDFVEMDFSMLEKKVCDRRQDVKSLYDIVGKDNDSFDYDTFKEKTERNLKDGNFNLLIVGDKVRANVERMVNFMNSYSKMSFTLAIVELQMFKLPDNSIFIVPYCIAKTVEWRLNVLQNEQTKTTVLDSAITRHDNDEFYKRLSQYIDITNTSALKNFVDDLSSSFPIITQLGRGKCLSLMIKTDDEQANLFTVSENGNVDFYGLIYDSISDQRKKIGYEYLNKLAEIFNFKLDTVGLHWQVVPRRNKKRVTISEFLSDTESWKNAISDYIVSKQKLDEANY